MLKDQLGQIWVGTWDGALNVWAKKDSSFKQFHNEAGNMESLYSDTITFMKKDHRGIIWIGTYRGLNRLDPATWEITRIPIPESFHKHVIKIFIDISGKLWIGMGDRRVLTYDPAAGDFQQYFVDQEGQPIIPYMNSQIFSVVENDRQRIWLGTAANRKVCPIIIFVQ